MKSRVELGIRASQQRARQALADCNATPIARFPEHLLEIIDFAALCGFADGFEAGIREGKSREMSA